jgi:hypothetical protein
VTAFYLPLGDRRFAPTPATENGLGLAHGDLSDATGHLGVVSQPLLVRARR